MGTRGYIVFFHRGRYYRFYNHWDSYFSGLGKSLVRYIKEASDLSSLLDEWRLLFNLGRPIDGQLLPPTEADDQALWKTTISKLPKPDIFPSLDNDGIDLEDDDNRKLFSDSIFIEYIYVLDLDNEEFIALDCLRNGIYCGYSLEYLQTVTVEEWVNLAEKNHAEFYHTFRLPSSIEKPLKDCIESKGYTLQKCVSWGEACVYKSLDSNTSEEVYIKGFLETFERSIPFAQVLKSNPHPNIVAIKEVFSLDTSEYPHLVLEPYDGSLDQLNITTLEGKKDFVKAIGDIAEGIAHIHRLGAVHGDIKRTNVLYRKVNGHEIEAAICDFESISVPSFKVNGAKMRNSVAKDNYPWKDLSWGPYCPDAANDNGDNDKQLWEKDWHRSKYSHCVRDCTSGWQVDSFCLSIEIGYFIDKIDKEGKSSSEGEKSLEEDTAENETEISTGDCSHIKPNLKEMQDTLLKTHNFETAICNLMKVKELVGKVVW